MLAVAVQRSHACLPDVHFSSYNAFCRIESRYHNMLQMDLSSLRITLGPYLLLESLSLWPFALIADACLEGGPSERLILKLQIRSLFDSAAAEPLTCAVWTPGLPGLAACRPKLFQHASEH